MRPDPSLVGVTLEADVLGCDGPYPKVRVKGLVGWTQNDRSNQFTTCV